ncbi:MAG: DUF1553 domain-containing protein [Verrucomicrobia bacterium]|nr:DUF1553 domain-containing protein [Verrucomicrobiota bacterium]
MSSVGSAFALALAAVAGAWPSAAGSADSAKADPPGIANAGSHWAFQPLKPTDPPRPAGLQSPQRAANPIDAFILRDLEAKGLSPNSPATQRDLIRRAYLDLVGLPPPPEAVEAFVADSRSDAWERLVDELLASPRYGERWAQHWLDVVRYADTHGFEVNTERPNAWPYRDYVIRAFNSDTPYDRFVREQLAGDAFGEDAALGFLVTAAALLPGQIGADDVSKRLARQDELSEIVANVGQAFLGLSVGCARCHDHKFDPIPQRDYYSMQAFFAGIEYGDRPIRTAATEARRRESETLKGRLADVALSLSRFEPIAQLPSIPRSETNARTNTLSFAPIEARHVRFTIHDANLHPTLGLIEPCVDEFEIFSADEPARNVALASEGAKVAASGSRTSDRHRLEHINDGRYGNSRSWMSDEAGRGWVEFELPRSVRIGRVAWSRDREGEFADRLPTAYTLEAGPDLEHMTRLSFVPPMRAPVNPRATIDRFAPATTKKLRFTINACTSLEPCIDEMEILTSGVVARNVALATAGTKVAASGSQTNSERHRLEHVNDGRYGNERSWISNEPGRGWLEFTFNHPETIDRVVWGRDREEKYSDRLPTDYLIEVSDESGGWRAVAGSGDRRKRGDGDKRPPAVLLAGLGAEEAKAAAELVAEQRALEKRIAALGSGPMVFAGTSKTPEITRLLHRGDPEQPRELAAPAALSALASMSLPAQTPEQERRIALASWIASADNPLTARVLVNRIWQGHFGVGLVETSSDFGRNGARPSHPELLDWLAGEFIRSGWSIKRMHRLILASTTFRQSSQIHAAAQAIDRDDRLLWRFPARRMEAEEIRDSMLAVSGRLNPRMGGRGFDLFKSRGGLDGFPPVEGFDEEGLRRMVYAHKVRMERDVVFGAFDCPDAGQSAPRRRQSTTPIQALNLFNSRFTLSEAEAFASRAKRESRPGATHDEWIERAYQIALGRKPDSTELKSARLVAQEHGLSTVCRVLLNSSEFLFIP